MKRILIIGGTGFLGRHLTEKLKNAGYHTQSIGRSSSPDLNGIAVDFSKHDPAKGATKTFDAVFHLASLVNIDEGLRKPKEFILHDLRCTLNILEDIRKHNPKCLLLFASSDKVYGDPGTPNVKESDPQNPLEPYGFSKLLSEQAIKLYHTLFDINYVIFRSANVFGPNQKPTLFIPHVLNSIAQGQTSVAVGDLSRTRNFVYVDDLIDAFTLALENRRTPNNTFNIMAYQLKISEVTTLITTFSKALLGYEVSFIRDDKRVRNPRSESTPFTLDCGKAEKSLGWRPKTNLHQALQTTFNSYINKSNNPPLSVVTPTAEK